MTYIELLNSFWDSTRFDPCSSNEATMYLYLLHQCNIRRWINPFEFKTRNLEIMLGLSRTSIGAIRNTLKQRGLIDFTKGVGSGSAIYFIVGAEVTNKELSGRFCVKLQDTNMDTNAVCVHSVDTMVDTTLYTMVDTKVDTNGNSTSLIEEIRHKEKRQKKQTKKNDVVDATAQVQGSLDFGIVEAPKRKTSGLPKAHPPTPTLEEVLEYFKLHADGRLQDWETSAKLFFDSYNATGWINKNGRHITNWDSEANRWIFYREKNEKSTPANENRQTDRFSERRGSEPANPKRKGFKGTF